MIIEDFNNTLAVIVVIDTKDLKLSVGEVEKLRKEAVTQASKH
jgi:hypothetical protein